MKKERLRIDNLRKGTILKQIHLPIFEGELIYCIFDNIQEKEMFLKIMGGVELPDSGKIYFEEQKIAESQIRETMKQCAAVITRDSNLIDSVTIAENLFLVRPKVREHWVKKHTDKKAARQIFEELQIHIDVDKPVASLSAFEKVQIEIAKAYLLKSKIIILTAISNTLGDKEKERLWQLLERMRIRRVSCMVMEPLEDIDFVYADRVAAVKHGKTCLEKPIDECDYVMLHTVLYRDEMDKRIDERQMVSIHNKGQETVAIRNLRAGTVKDLSLEIGRGEIVKLFCVDEDSYESVTRIFRGAGRVEEGWICTRGIEKEISGFIRGLPDKIGVVEGNPIEASLFTELTAMDNLQMLLSRKVNGIWIIPKYKKSIRLLLKNIVEEEVFSKKIKNLPPSDVQKIVYCRWLIYSPELLVCIQPFAEGDIQARETAREMMYLLQERKIPLLLITSNTAELNYCRGREVYMRHGRIIDKEEAY